VKAPKLDLADPGMLGALLGAGASRVRDDDGFAGAIFETFVAARLERRASWSPEPLTIWRLREGDREADIVLERPSGEIIGIQVRASATVRARDSKGLAYLRQRRAGGLLAGVVLHAGDQVLAFGERLWALALQAMWDRALAAVAARSACHKLVTKSRNRYTRRGRCNRGPEGSDRARRLNACGRSHL
jgi:uncharacterized protein